ncbi:MAG: 3-aminobutyryl-CoA ammonia lyase [Thermotogae bacterium]|nr:3-aminobutyryl-CoA ammonia lyase [Thermotogota bacterium]
MAYEDWDKPSIRIRISESDVHYAGGLVDGAKMMQLFGDVATELLIISDGDEGLFRAYDTVEFLAPVHAGDYIEVYGKIKELGKTSRKMYFEAYKVIAPVEGQTGACDVLAKPLLVAEASGTCVVPFERQRKSQNV